MASEPVTRSGQQRPSSVVIATLLQVIQGAGLLGYGIYQLITHGWELDIPVGGWRYIPFPLFESISSGLILTMLGAFTLIVAVAFWFLWDPAWMAAMTMQGLGLVVGLINYLRDRPNYTGMVLGVVIVFYLNHGEVRQMFRWGKR
jgi:hypothetical protein